MVAFIGLNIYNTMQSHTRIPAAGNNLVRRHAHQPYRSLAVHRPIIIFITDTRDVTQSKKYILYCSPRDKK